MKFQYETQKTILIKIFVFFSLAPTDILQHNVLKRTKKPFLFKKNVSKKSEVKIEAAFFFILED